MTLKASFHDRTCSLSPLSLFAAEKTVFTVSRSIVFKSIWFYSLIHMNRTLFFFSFRWFVTVYSATNRLNHLSTFACVFSFSFSSFFSSFSNFYSFFTCFCRRVFFLIHSNEHSSSGSFLFLFSPLLLSPHGHWFLPGRPFLFIYFFRSSNGPIFQLQIAEWMEKWKVNWSGVEATEERKRKEKWKSSFNRVTKWLRETTIILCGSCAWVKATFVRERERERERQRIEDAQLFATYVDAVVYMSDLTNKLDEWTFLHKETANSFHCGEWKDETTSLDILAPLSHTDKWLADEFQLLSTHDDRRA